MPRICPKCSAEMQISGCDEMGYDTWECPVCGHEE